MKSAGIKSYKQVQIKESYDAIIIGSGISGMACAAILAKSGKKPLVLEAHYTAGGYTHVFKRNGYEWDVGIHYIGGLNHDKSMLSMLFHYISDGQMSWADMGEVYDKIIFGDEVFDFHKGPENFIAHLKEQFPNPLDQRAIDSYMTLVKEANKSSRTFFMQKAFPPEMAPMGEQMREPFLRFSRQTTREVLEELSNNEKLIGVLTGQFGDYGLPPSQSSFAMHALLTSHYFYGGSFPVGGSERIAQTIGDVIAEAGGLILTNAPVAEILVEDETAVGVRLADGKELHAPLVISAAGVFNTYQKLLPKTLQEAYDLDEKLDKVTPSVAHLGLYIGFDASVEELGLQKANYWIYPEGQYDHDANIDAYLNNPDAEFPLVYISFPAAKDPEWENRYPGKATVDIITLAPYEWFTEWEDSKWKRRGEAYEAFKEKLSQRLLKVLYKYEPQLEGKVDHYELSTPLSTRQFVNYSKGEIYGLEHSGERFEQDFLRPYTPIQNLYLTGQDIVTCGIGGALMSAVLTMSAIDKKDYTSEIRQEVAKELAL